MRYNKSIMHDYYRYFKSLLKLNLLDYVIIFISGLIVLSLIFVFSKKDRWITIEVKVKTNEYKSVYFNQISTAPYNFAVNKLMVGDTEKNAAGTEIARVIDIKSWGDFMPETWIVLKIKATYDKQRGIYRYKYQNVSIGQSIKLILNSTGVDGIITYIEGTKDNRVTEEKTIYAKLVDLNSKYLNTLGVEPWVAASVKTADKMYDSRNQVVAEIMDVKVNPAIRTVQTNTGTLYATTDPVLKDVILKLKIKTMKNNGVSYFLEDWPIKIDQAIPLFLDKINLYPRIIEILP